MMKIRVFSLAMMSLAVAVFAFAGQPALAEDEPSKKELKKHKTTPGAQYSPSMDVMEFEEEEPAAKPKVPDISKKEFAAAQKIYFERCAGCHGVLRKGATGKALTTDITREQGYDYLNAFITYGSPGGMPNWGESGQLSEKEVDVMTRFLLHEPPQPPEFGMEQIKASWNLIVPVDKRPTKKMNKLERQM